MKTVAHEALSRSSARESTGVAIAAPKCGRAESVWKETLGFGLSGV
jgi:hypothetical protein